MSRSSTAETEEDTAYYASLKEHFALEHGKLPHDHTYLKLLRGCFDELLKRESLSSSGPQSESLLDSPELQEQAAELQAWRGLVEEQCGRYNFRAYDGKAPHRGIEHDEENDEQEIRNLCNRCSEVNDIANDFFYCEECGIPPHGFDLCSTCANKGEHCDEPTHRLRLVRTIVKKFDTLHRVLAPDLHSISRASAASPTASVRSDALEEGNLRALVNAYFGMEPKFNRPRLGFALGMYRGPDESVDDQLNIPPSVKLIHAWRLLCHSLLYREAYYPPITEFMSREQLAVVKLLLEWWHGDIVDLGLTSMAVGELLIRDILGTEQPADIHVLAGNARSEYHATLHNLFEIELMARSPRISVLRIERAAAARIASVQRLGCSFIHQNMKPSWHEPWRNVHEEINTQTARMVSNVHPAIALCHATDPKNTARFAVELMKASFVSMQLVVEHMNSGEELFGPTNACATVVPCAWLKKHERESLIPYYLWDKRAGCTICTKDLVYLPEYTVVSHTWGRWKIKDSDVDLPGVPWKIPRNSRFDVTEMKNMLSGVPGSGSYVWFDLVCIPQTTADPTLQAIARQEISRQAAIFSHAEVAVAWFSNIEDFGALEDMCTLLALNATRFPGPFARDAVLQRFQVAQNIYAAVWKSRQFTPLARKQTFDGQARWNEVLDEWFTSLWTLQEVCMRPDMWLCTRSWEPLTSRASGVVIPLDCMMSLVRENAWLLQSGAPTKPPNLATAEEVLEMFLMRPGAADPDLRLLKSKPPSLHNFLAYVLAAALIEIPGIERVKILTLGNQRYCRRRRAEAIMSVLGVTKWFHRQDIGAHDGGELVLQRYAMDFVLEVRQELGDIAFFGANIARDFWSRVDHGQNFEHQVETLKLTATLLPFGDSESVVVARIPDLEHRFPLSTSEVHAAVEHWRILPSGHVIVPSAKICASSTQMQPSSLVSAYVYVMDHHTNINHHINNHNDRLLARTYVDFNEWITGRAYNCYAVALERETVSTKLERSLYLLKGPLFRELRPGVMIKMGHFETRMLLDDGSFDWTEEQKVDWLVL